MGAIASHEKGKKEDDEKKGRSGCFEFWTPSYLWDYVGLLLVIIMLLYYDTFYPLANQDKVWDISDPAVFFPLQDDSVTVEEVLLWCVAPSFVLYMVFFIKNAVANYQLSGSSPSERKFSFAHLDFEDSHAIILVLLGAIGVSNFIFFTFKAAVRRPRPDFAHRCAPKCLENYTWTCVDISEYEDPSHCAGVGSPTCCPAMCDFNDDRLIVRRPVQRCSYIQNGNNIRSMTIQQLCPLLHGRMVLGDESGCMGSPGTGQYDAFSYGEGFNSFPSGHVINIFGVYTFNWLYVAGKLQVYGKGVKQRQYFWGFAVMSAGILAAVYVGVSRVSDNKHYPLDTLVGALIGIVPVFFVYPLYFQSIFDGGRPLRRPKRKLWAVLSHLWCADSYLEKPWPLDTYLPSSQMSDFGEDEEIDENGSAMVREHEYDISRSSEAANGNNQTTKAMAEV